MHPDAPEWAREVLDREIPHASFRSFVVLKDGPVQKLAVAEADDGLYVVQKTVAGAELFRVARPERGPASQCASCGATFRVEGAVSRVHCVACGAPLPEAAPEPIGRHAFEGIEGIGDAHTDALIGAGVPDRAALARADAARVREATGASPAVVDAWQATARLLELSDLTATDARKLADAGITDVRDLALRDPDLLAQRVGVPTDRALAWVEAARARR